jgi:type II secretory pathway pseudopilin PulG
MSTHLKKNDSNKGFTLVEVLVVSTLAILLMITVTSIFITFISSSGQTKLKQQLQVEGNQTLDKMERLLRGSKNLSTNNVGDICTTGMASIGFESFAGGKGVLYEVSNRIASDSGVLNDADTIQTYYLTSDQLDVDTTNHDLTFDCYQGEDSYFVKISFGLMADTTKSPTDRTVKQTFSTGVQLRNTD